MKNIQPQDQVRHKIWDQIMSQLGHYLRTQLWHQLGNQFRDQLGDQTWNQLRMILLKHHSMGLVPIGVPSDEYKLAIKPRLLRRVRCKLCGELGRRKDAHRHQGNWIGVCCWDERLRTTE